MLAGPVRGTFHRPVPPRRGLPRRRTGGAARSEVRGPAVLDVVVVVGVIALFALVALVASGVERL